MGQVRGFTDILYPQNMAVNGSFRINQRGLFQDQWQAVKFGDYVADAWQCTANTIDNIYCRNDASRAYDGSDRRDGIVFYGAGKKGQTFTMESVDIHRPASVKPSHSADALHYTATVRARINTFVDNVETQKSVPVAVSVYGPRNANFYGVHYPNTTSVIVSSSENNGNTIKQAVSPYYSGNNYIIFWRPTIQISLLSDGEFHVVLSNFAIYPGILINPPQVAEVHLADDLLRCKRYYQRGRTNIRALGADTSTQYQLGVIQHFEVEMAGIPTLTQEIVEVYEEGGASGLGNYDIGYPSPTSKHFSSLVYKPAGGNKPNIMSMDWTATV